MPIVALEPSRIQCPTCGAYRVQPRIERPTMTCMQPHDKLIRGVTREEFVRTVPTAEVSGRVGRKMAYRITASGSDYVILAKTAWCVRREPGAMELASVAIGNVLASRGDQLYEMTRIPSGTAIKRENP